MNYFNQPDMDADQWVEIIKKSKKQTTSEFKEDEAGKVSLGLTAPANPPPFQNVKNWAYFITLCFPTRHEFKIKHLELKSQGNSRIVFSPIKYGDCTQQEQYEWVIFILRKHINIISDNYDLFFEQTKEGNIHIHGRIGYDGKKKSQKDVRALFHRIFECPTKFKPFCDIKEYDHSKWSSYDTKIVKTYQTLEYSHFKNI